MGLLEHRAIFFSRFLALSLQPTDSVLNKTVKNVKWFEGLLVIQ